MAETENTCGETLPETRLAALEKSIAELVRQGERQGRTLDAMAANLLKTTAALSEIQPLVRQAAPLLDSPMVKLAGSPAGTVLGMFTKGGRRG